MKGNISSAYIQDELNSVTRAETAAVKAQVAAEWAQESAKKTESHAEKATQAAIESAEASKKAEESFDELNQSVPFSDFSVSASRGDTPFISYDKETGTLTLNSNAVAGNWSVGNKYTKSFSYGIDTTPISFIFAEDDTYYYVSNINKNTVNLKYIGGLLKVNKSTGAETSVTPTRNTYLERNFEKGEKLLMSYEPNITVTANGTAKTVNRYVLYRKRITDVCFRQFMVYDLDTTITPIIGFYSYATVKNINIKGLYIDVDIPEYPVYDGYTLINNGKSDYVLEHSAKKWLAIGDSLTAFGEASYGDSAIDATDDDTENSTYGINYINFVEAITGYQACRKDTGNNYGYAGYALGGSGDHGMATIYNAKHTEWDDAETNLITLFAGTNDYYYGTEIGTIDDYINATGVDTIYGALRLYIDYFKTKGINNELDIVLITPIQRFDEGYARDTVNTKGYCLKDYVNAIKAVGAYESLKVVDLYNNGGIGEHNYKEVLKDDCLHPNKQGYEIIAEHICKALASAAQSYDTIDKVDKKEGYGLSRVGGLAEIPDSNSSEPERNWTTINVLSDEEDGEQEIIIPAYMSDLEDDIGIAKTFDAVKHEVLDITANAVKNTVTGEIVRIDDVSPTMQWSKVFLSTEDKYIDLLDVGIKRYGKNLFDPTALLNAPGWTVENDIYHGLKVELNDIFLKSIILSLVDDICFKPNTQYTLSFLSYVDEVGTSCLRFNYDDGTYTEIDTDVLGTEMPDKRYCFTSEVGKTVTGITFTGSLGNIYFKDIQLEVGDKATEYEPFVIPTTHKRDNSEDFYTTKVYTEMRVTDDASGYSVRNDISFVKIPFEEAGRYKLRFTKLGGEFLYVSEVFANCLTDSTQNIRFQVEDYSNAYCNHNGSTDLRVDGGGNPENTIFQINDWMEYDIDIPLSGEYEIGLKMGSAVNSQQTLRVTIDETCLGAYMLYPTSTILTDTEGVSLTCIYNRDTNKITEHLVKTDGTNATGTWEIDISGTAAKANRANWAVSAGSATSDDFNNSLSDYVYDITMEDTSMTLVAGNGWEKKTMEVATPAVVANAVKNTVSGEAIAISDASPLEHEGKVTVYGKNRIDLKNKDKWVEAGSTYQYNFKLEPGRYYISGSHTDFQGCLAVCGIYADGTTDASTRNYISTTNNTGTITFTRTFVVKEEYDHVQWWVEKSRGIDNIDNIDWIQMENGTAKTDYVDYVEPSSVSLTKYGKNLIPDLEGNILFSESVSEIEQHGIKIQKQGNNTYIIHAGTCECEDDVAVFYLYKGLPHIRPETQLSKDNPTDGTYVLGSYNNGGTLPYIYVDTNGDVSFQIPNGTVISSNTYYYLNVALGTAATGFVNYLGHETFVPNDDGTVNGVMLDSDYTSLLTDTEGITIRCVYNQDTNKVIEKLTNAIISLGGNV